MVLSVGSLANMEMMLYGGTLGANTNCPSMFNGYQAGNWNNSIYNQNLGGYYNQYNPSFRGGQNSIYDTAASNAAANQQVGFGASAKDLDTLAKYHLKGMAPSESMMAAGLGGAAFTFVTNPRWIVHPFNNITAIKGTEEAFIKAGIKDTNSALYKLWNNPEKNGLIRDAYTRLQHLEAGKNSRISIFKSKIDDVTYNALKNELTSALKNGNVDDIAKATEKVRTVIDAKTGWVANLFRSEKQTAASVLNGLDDATIKAAAAKNITEKATHTLTDKLAHSFKNQRGIMGAPFFAAMEYFMDWDNIKSAFEKDNETGMKQLGQTTVKAAGSIIGFAVGDAVGAWAGAKLGMALGTAICPGVGTAIGAVAGLAGGMIGMNLMGKFTHWLTGDSVGAKAKAEKMKKTAQGQAELLQLTAQQAQGDKNLDPSVAQALQNVAAVYQAA